MTESDDGGNAVFSAFMQTGAIVDVCYEYGPAVPFCAGHGSGAACPCGNASQPGAGQGCLNSLGLGAQLRASGSAHLAVDSLTLTCTNLPATVLFFQGTGDVAGGAGAVFGDGLRCAGGTTTRPAARTAVAGAASYPPAGGLGPQGGATPGTTLRYQAWYRNPAPFCAPAGFNLSNGLRVRWKP